MTEKPVGIHVVEMPNFTLRIFGRRSRFSKWYSHIAEVTPKLKAPRDLPERFDFKTVSIYPHPVCSQCSFRVPALWLSIKSPSRLVLSRTVAEKLIPSLARRELPAISNYKLIDKWQ